MFKDELENEKLVGIWFFWILGKNTFLILSDLRSNNILEINSLFDLIIYPIKAFIFPWILGAGVSDIDFVANTAIILDFIILWHQILVN